MMMVPTAAHRVLNTTELLEHIIIHLPMDGINNARQVNRFFRTVVKNSKPLREPIFRVLGHNKALEHILTHNASIEEVLEARKVCRFFKNVVDTSPSLRQTMFLDPAPIGRKLNIQKPMIATQPKLKKYHPLNPIPQSSTPHRRAPLSVTKIHPAIISPQVLRRDSDDDPEFLSNILAPDKNWTPGLWRSMLICQPPCPKIVVYYRIPAASRAGPNTKRNVGSHMLFSHPIEGGNTLGALADDIAEQPDYATFYALRIIGFVVEKHRLVGA